MIIHPNGKESVSMFNTLKNYKDCSLIQVTILTGRKHQIRVQCASLNHPILNDSLYGGKKIDNTGLLLQSHHIQFNDVDITCPQEKDSLENRKSYILSNRQSIHQLPNTIYREGYAFFYTKSKVFQVKH